MNHKLSIAFLIIFLTGTMSYGNGLINSYFEPDTSFSETTKALKRMRPSISSKTSKGNPYSMYAFKVKKDWVFLVNDSLTIFSMKYDNEEGELVEAEKNITELFCLAVKSESYKKKNKARTIAGTDIVCYYKLLSKATKTYNSVKSLNGKARKVTSEIRKGYNMGKRNKSKIKGAGKKLKRVNDSKGKSLL